MSKAFLVEGTSIIPCPGCSEIEIQDKIKKGRLCLYGEGFIVTEEKRIRNLAFDKKGEKTSTKLVWRAVKNEDEVKFIIRELGGFAKTSRDSIGGVRIITQQKESL